MQTIQSLQLCFTDPCPYIDRMITTITYLNYLEVVLCTAKQPGLGSSSCWYTLNSSALLEAILDCSGMLLWLLLLHFGR